MFADRLERAYNDGRPSALSAFMATGRAYLDFARSNPGYYMAMFESGVSIAGNAELALAAERAMSVLVRAAERLAAHLPADRRPPAGDGGEPHLGVSATAWSSSSAAAGRAAGRPIPPRRCWRAAR